MSRFQLGYLLYGLWLLAWLGLELAAIFGAPWPTLSATSWHAEAHWKLLRVVLLAGLAVLLVHIVFRFP